VEGPYVPVQPVIDVLWKADMSVPERALVSAELDAGRLPSGAHGVPVPEIVAMTPEGRCAGVLV
jgi:hypothetical protein